jgi:hypothetical protein
MKQLALGTNWIKFDEPCLGLYELDYQSPGYKSFHRYQICLVFREIDKVAEYRKDLGPSEKFKGVDQIRIPGGIRQPNGQYVIAHKVGELMDIADKLRSQNLFDKKDLIGVNQLRET